MLKSEEMATSMPLQNNSLPTQAYFAAHRVISKPNVAAILLCQLHLNIVSWGAFRTIKEFLKIAIHIPQIEKGEEPLLEYGGKEARGREEEFRIHANQILCLGMVT